MAKKDSNSGSATMRPRARLISLLGAELISDEPVAVVELVKNAFDADATSVSIRFEGSNPNDPDTLVVEDNGEGMTLDTVLTAWFEPGTTNKKKRARSPKGRPYQGAKGVGRFAAARLAESLLMETKRRGKSEGVSVLLEWGRFDEESYLDEISLEYATESLPTLKHGTRLSLINLQSRKHWHADDFRSLHNRLSRLISPFDSDIAGDKAPDFEVLLEIPAYPEFTGKVEAHELTQSPKYRLNGAVSSAGLFSGKLTIDGKSAKVYKKHQLAKKDEAVLCGGFEVEVRAWDRDRPGLSPFMLKFDQSLTAVRNILDEYCGVSIYRDGFRVHPYGEKGNDWLSLDTRSRQTPTLRLANNQIVAAIRITRDDNPELLDRTTREGLVHNHAYHALRDWFVRVLLLIEEERYRLRPRDQDKPEEFTTLYEPFDMSDVVVQVDRQLGKRHPVTELVRRKDVDVREGVKRLQEHYSRLLMAAGLGQLVDVVIHEIGAPLGRIGRELAYVEKLLVKSLDANALDKLLGASSSQKLATSLESARTWVEQIANFRERLLPKAAGKRGRATSFSIQEEVRDNIALYESLLEKQKIKWSIREPSKPLVVHMSRSNFGQIVANLLDNAIYWLTYHHGDGKGGLIDIGIRSTEHGFRLVICDDGGGVREEDRERIFDQQFSRKPYGMGLGLYIARQVIEPYGRLVYRDDCKLPGACFEAIFEQRVGL